MIPENIIENVRNETNIADVIGQYVALHKSGKNLFGLCPFHEEKTPSFSVNEQKQIFHCFSCGRGGNVFKFIMEVDNLSYPQAVLKVAKMQDIKVPQNYVASNEQQNHKLNTLDTKLVAMHEKAASLYNHLLMNTETGQVALSYLHQRGLTDDTIAFYKLGFSPTNSILQAFLEHQGFNYQEMRKSGLFVESEDGSLKDRFFNRIMFPIKNEADNIIAFSGRVLHVEDSQAKYLNSPETSIFNKRKTLYNFSNVKKSLTNNRIIILFEGFMDVISAYQSGVTNGVASMGTSLTSEQIYILKRNAQKLYVCYDGDVPGQNAINRALTILSDTQLKLGVIQMPNNIDPDEYRRKYGETKFAEYMKTALESPLSFKMRFLKLNRNLDNETDQLSYINDVLKEVAKIADPLERDIYLNQLVTRFNLNKNTLINKISGFIHSNSFKQVSHSKNYLQLNDSIQNAKAYGKVEKAERYLLHRILESKEQWDYLMTKEHFMFADDKYQMLYVLAQGYMQINDQYNSAKFQDFIKDDTSRQLLNGIEMENISEYTSLEEIDDYVNIIMTEAPLDKQISEKKADLEEAKKLGDIDRQTKITMDIIKLQRKKQLIG
jgi:DNA primase